MISYHLYANSGAGDPIDYDTVVDTVSGLTWTSGALAYPGVWKFGVRAFDGSSEESNVDAVVKLTLDGSGVDVSLIPDPPTAISAHANGSGRIVVDWHHAVLDPARKPTGFHVYQGTSGTVSYTSPVAAVPFASGLMVYAASITGLTGGTAYTFGVRAYNAAGEEAGTTTATATAAVSPTLTVSDLSGSAIA